MNNTAEDSAASADEKAAEAEPTERDALLPSNKSAENKEDDTAARELDGEKEEREENTTTMLGTIYEAMEDFVEDAREFTNAFSDNVQEVAGDVKDAIVEEFREVTDAFMDELNEADDEEDKNYLLEMGLTRHMSILPSDVAEAAAAMVPSQTTACTVFPISSTGPYQEQRLFEYEEVPPFLDEKAPSLESMDDLKRMEQQVESISTTTPVSAYLLLASAVISLSAIGPLLDLQRGVGPTMKVYWRTSATAWILLPFAIHSLMRDGFPHMTYSHWCMLLLSAASYASMGVFFVWALQDTAVGNAVIFSNSQSLLLLVGKIFVGDRISLLEATGAIVAFTGAVLCSKDSSDVAAGSGLKTVLGDIFAMGSALCGVAYLVFARTVRPSMNLYVFMFLIMFIGSLQTLLFLFVSPEPVSFDFNEAHGIFGWMDYRRPDRLALEIVMVVVCCLFGAMGYVRAMHYFDNLMISVAALMEPVTAELLGCIAGSSDLPGPTGWLGNLLVACGTFAVIYQPPGKSATSGHDHAL